MAEYKLSAALDGHEDDVRAVSFPMQSLITSASRDTTVRSWKLQSAQPPTYDGSISSHAQSFVNSLAFSPPSTKYPRGLIISGGKDTVIEARQVESPPEENAERILLGHAHNVCSLDVSIDNQFLVSGSWDSTARVWNLNSWECDAVLEGHGGSVWAVLAYDQQRIITGCADQIVRVFDKGGKIVSEMKGTTDVVRSLCRVSNAHVSGADFASAGNDAVIRLWRMNGAEVGQLHGHENFIYSLASLRDGRLVSSGEDRTVRIWQGYECVQTITHPAISVWSVAVCHQSEDIVSGASDRVVRVFSMSPERMAALDLIQAFEESVKASSIPKQQVADINKEKLPDPDFLQRKSGTKEGQIQMIKEADGRIGAYQWSQGQRAWTNVGTVVDAAGSSGRKTSYRGKDYDYVFEVDIEDGKPPLKLPFNLSQNPYEAATLFLQDNELPATYLDQVANFITTNTQGATIGQQQSSRPPPGADPWGTESRYRPGEQATPHQEMAGPKLLPQTTYISIKTANIPVILKKVLEFNERLVRDGSSDLALTEQELLAIRTISGPLEASLLANSTAEDSAIAASVPAIARMLLHWPPSFRLPVLDLARLLAASSPTFASFRSPEVANAVDLLLSSGFEDKDRENNIMLAIRALGNLLESSAKKLVMFQFDSVHGHIRPNLSNSNRNMTIAIATLYINFGVYAGDTALDQPPSISKLTIGLINDCLKLIKGAADAEGLYRSLVALGTLVHVRAATGGPKTNNALLSSALDQAERKGAEPRIKGISREIRELLR